MRSQMLRQMLSHWHLLPGRDSGLDDFGELLQTLCSSGCMAPAALLPIAQVSVTSCSSMALLTFVVEHLQFFVENVVDCMTVGWTTMAVVALQCMMLSHGCGHFLVVSSISLVQWCWQCSSWCDPAFQCWSCYAQLTFRDR